jgi:hypothetical protein
MKTSAPADVLYLRNVPELGFVTFTALTDDTAGFLDWLAAAGIEGTWDGLSMSVPSEYDDGSEADYIYQTCLMNGLVIEFGDGDRIHSPGAVAAMEEIVKAVEGLQCD